MENEDVRQEQQSNIHEVANDFDPLLKESTESPVLISIERASSPRKDRRQRNTTSLQAENLITLSLNANLLIEAGISIPSTAEEEQPECPPTWLPSPTFVTQDQTSQEKNKKEDSKSHPAIARKIITGEKKDSGNNKKLFGLTLSKKARTALINETHKGEENVTGKELSLCSKPHG